MNDTDKVTLILEKMTNIIDKQSTMISNLYAILIRKGIFNDLDSDLIAGKITLNEYIEKSK